MKQRLGVDDRASASSEFRTAIIWHEPSQVRFASMPFAPHHSDDLS